MFVQKKWRLTQRTDFQKVYRTGKSHANSQFVVYYRRNLQVDQFRLGVSVSKKIGSAVVRNRIRRMMKEIVRLHATRIKDNIDFVLIARKPVLHQDYGQMEKSILHVLKRAQLLK